MWRPKGFISLREAVIRTAGQFAPDADVRAYLTVPNPADQPDDPLVNAVRSFHYDPMQHPVGGMADHPAWIALEAARGELLQALGDEVLTVTVLDADGTAFDLPPQAWRIPEAPDDLRREAVIARAQQQTFMVQEQPFARWLRGEQAEPPSGELIPPTSLEAPLAKVRRGGVDYRARDEPLCERMREIVLAEGIPPFQAAWKVVADAAGGGTNVSKAKRLTERYADRFKPVQD